MPRPTCEHGYSIEYDQHGSPVCGRCPPRDGSEREMTELSSLPDFAERAAPIPERPADPAVDSFWYQVTVGLVAQLVTEQGTRKASDLLAHVDAAARTGFSNRITTMSLRGISRGAAVELLDEMRQIYTLSRTGLRPGAESTETICIYCLRVAGDRPREKYCDSGRAPQMPDGKNPHCYVLVTSDEGRDALKYRRQEHEGIAPNHRTVADAAVGETP